MTAIKSTKIAIAIAIAFAVVVIISSFCLLTHFSNIPVVMFLNVYTIPGSQVKSSQVASSLISLKFNEKNYVANKEAECK